MKRLIPLLGFILCLLSCTQEPEFTEAVELGCGAPQVTVAATAGAHSFNIISGGSCKAELT